MEWVADEKFSTNTARVKNREELEHMIEEITAKKTTEVRILA